MLRRSFLVMLVLMLALPGAAACAPGRVALDLDVVAGEWSGEVSQPDSEEETTYRLDVELFSTPDDEDAIGSASYPELDCTARWFAIRDERAASIVLERLVTPGECVDEGTVSLSYDVDDDIIHYEWIEDPDDDGGRSIAQLSRL